MSVVDAKKYLTQGEFASGSMGPKIEAAIEFLEAGGKEVIITTPELIEKAMEGEAGTRIY
jgi:carbamate kinase